MNKILTKEILMITLIDFIILSLVIFLPAISHLLPFPMYFLDPMRLMLFVGFILSKNTNNAYVLALVIPLFSFIVTGHPIIIKSMLISIELLINITFFITFVKKIKDQIFFFMLLSILLSKMIYYLLKYLLLSLNYLDGSLFSTSIFIQLVYAIIISMLFSYFYNKVNK